MSHLFPGRYSAQTDDSFADPFVVFLIGMLVNRVFALRRWTRVAAAMPSMLAELKQHPELGLLHVETAIYWRGILTIQYWRSFEHLHAYAHLRDSNHLPAWAEFNRGVGNDGSVGIWHETFMVARGQHESVYVNMPRFGLAAAADLVPVTGGLESARGRVAHAARPQPAPDIVKQ